MDHIGNLFNVITYLLNNSIDEKDKNIELVMKYFKIHIDILESKDDVQSVKKDNISETEIPENIVESVELMLNFANDITENATEKEFKMEKSQEPSKQTMNLNSNEVPNESDENEMKLPVIQMTTSTTKRKNGKKYKIIDIISCLFCDQDFTNDEILVHDEDIHMVDNMFKCQDCNYISPLKKEVVVHYASEHKHLSYFHCRECKEVFFDTYLLQEHMKIIHNIEVPRLSCPICLEPQKGKKKPVLTHMELEHNIVKRKCEHCAKLFTTTVKLLSHLSINHPIGGVKQKTCNVCNKTVSLAFFPHHMDVHTKTEKDVPCPTCGNLFSTRKKMLVHKSRMHIDTLPVLKCTDCEYTTKVKIYFKNHRRVHLDINSQLQCDQCEKRFKSPKNLNEHLKSHSGLKDLPCRFCDKMFRRTSQRYMHELKHKGKIAATCTICDKNFYQKGNFKLHLKIHHPENELINKQIK